MDPSQDHAESPEERYDRIHRWLRQEVWPVLAPDGPSDPVPRSEWGRYLGYGSDE
ncbi:hypothetical protein [Conexibacter arvalis]|uniref:Acyl-CoA dehydrogenase n=1 Tax=Conexibacter arvalis TaxID=912552 RepID=A0A840I7I4_9ACTN|nr:hypothetical protein [Conexibacter arvalis]MBB4660849.1 hypothetical protein [Conexibacter arvalis]